MSYLLLLKKISCAAIVAASSLGLLPWSEISGAYAADTVKKSPVSKKVGVTINAKTASAPELVDRIVASIDGEPITVADLSQYIDLREVQVPNTDSASALKERIDGFIAQALVEREAKSSGVDVSEQEITAYIDEIKRQNGVDDKAFVEMLGTRKLSLESYKKHVRSEILRSRVVGARVRAKISVSDGDIERYVAEHPELAPAQDSVHLQQIFIAKSQELSLDLGASNPTSIVDVAAKVKDGVEFSEAYGPGYSDLGYVKVEDLRSEIQQAARELEPGEVSDVIEGEKGVYLVKVVARNEDEKVELPETLKESIRNELFQARLKDEITKYLNEELPKKYNVELVAVH